MLAIALSSYGPDLVELALNAPRYRGGTGIYSHSMMGVACGALLAAVAYRLIARRPGALVIAFAWILHLVMDLVTGLKPLFSLAHPIGLDLYHLAWADALVECTLVVVACVLYARALSGTPASRRLVYAAGAALVALQVEGDRVLGKLDTLPWSPSLVSRPAPSHFVVAQPASTQRAH